MSAVVVQESQLSRNQWSVVTPLGSVADWYLDSLETVKRLGNMPENWDGFGSPSLPVRATIAAGYLLSLVSQLTWTPPHIAPVPGGGIQLEWDYDKRSLELEVHPNGDMDFVVAEGNEIFVSPLSEKTLPNLFIWLRRMA
jgi:hypothetical protein